MYNCNLWRHVLERDRQNLEISVKSAAAEKLWEDKNPTDETKQ